MQTPRFWRHLEATLGARVARVHKVERVQQRDGRVRFDVFVPQDQLEATVAFMRNASRRLGWHARPHVPYRERAQEPGVRGGRGGRQMGRNPAPPRLKVCSLNIGSIKTKRQDLGVFAAREKLAVLALQETRRQQEHWRFRLSGYHSLEAMASPTRPGHHGLALLVRDDINAYEVGDESGVWLFARLFGGPLAQPWIVGTFYRPHKASEGREALRGLKAQVHQLRGKYPQDPILVLGDWNLRRDQVARKVQRWPTQLGLLAARGSPQSFFRGQRGDIDHILITPQHAHLVGQSAVLRAWDLSDHWPVWTRIEAAEDPLRAPETTREVFSGLPPKPGARREGWREQFTKERDALRRHNMWAPLIPLMEADEAEAAGTAAEREAARAQRLDSAAEAFTTTSFDVARSLGKTTEVKRGGQQRSKTFVSASHRRAVERRLRAYEELRDAQDAEERAEAAAAYKAARDKARRTARKEARQRWHQHVGKAAGQMVEEPRSFWKWAASIGGWKLKAASRGLQPMRDEHGVLLTDADAIGAAWSRHYQRLADDVTGHSQDPEHWRQHIQDWGFSTLEELNAPITREELLRTAMALKRYKAPGEDGLTAEWMKQVLDPSLELAGLEELDKEDWESSYPQSPMERVVLRLLNQVWETGYIPSCWRRAQLVSILKKGDPLDMDNYRGISLMAVPLKLLLAVLARRLSDRLVAEGRLAQEQGGFRVHEECVGQAAALLEVLQRREIKGERTYAMFVDLSKAYDTVPHEALFAKMDQLGVRGRMLSFVKGLYAVSEMQVRLPTGNSPTIQLGRGVRQGCPLSPILFNIFINDMFGRPDRLRTKRGVTVPGVAKAEEGLFAGLLFADDLVGLESSRSRMQRLANQVTRWCDKWEMRVGIGKCGVMCVGSDAGQASLAARPIMLQQQRVPVVEEYLYLGLTFRRDLSVKAMLAPRLEKARAAMGALHPFLCTASIPLASRVLVVKAVILAKLLYGSELWGMQQERCAPAQTLLNKTLRSVAGGKAGDSSMPNGALWREVCIAPVYALASARRARALKKFPTLRTWIAVFMRTNPRFRRRTWITGSLTWMRRLHRAQLAESVTVKVAMKQVMADSWARLEATRALRASRRYGKRGEHQWTRDVCRGGVTQQEEGAS